ncbi:MAG: hypothetical protein IV094_05640 [Vitreoscilla sp.]|nr:hypothetical protein [Vitreoscilla sp.]
MTTDELLRQQWLDLRGRLQARGLLASEGASLSLRVPATDAMWFGLAGDTAPQRVPLRAASGDSEVHAAAYGARADVGAIAVGGAGFGRCLADFNGVMPQAFDEQARHLGPMGPAAAAVREVAASLRKGGNALLVQGRPVYLGMTATRLALNAELFEKCAKAYVLAVAGGGRVRPLPWIVRLVANRRLHKDEARAARRFAQGLLPEEAKGY